MKYERQYMETSQNPRKFKVNDNPCLTKRVLTQNRTREYFHNTDHNGNSTATLQNEFNIRTCDTRKVVQCHHLPQHKKAHLDYDLKHILESSQYVKESDVNEMAMQTSEISKSN